MVQVPLLPLSSAGVWVTVVVPPQTVWVNGLVMSQVVIDSRPPPGHSALSIR